MPIRRRRRPAAAPESEGAAPLDLPVLPVRSTVLFPHMVTPLFVGRERSLRAVEQAMAENRALVVVAQRNEEIEDVDPDDLYTVATEGVIGRLLKMPDGTTSIMIQGERRLRVRRYVANEGYLRAEVVPIEETVEKSPTVEATMKSVLALYEKTVRLSRSLSEESYVAAVNADEPGWLADLIAASLDLPVATRQDVLETIDPVERLQRVTLLLSKELDVLEMEGKIQSEVHRAVDEAQRDRFLREQMHQIQKELGETDPQMRELSELREKIHAAGMPAEVAKKAEGELNRMALMPSASPEVGVIRNYLDWLTSLPWSKATQDNLRIKRAAAILESNHYGLPRVKERILEHIAVRKLAADKQRSPILCFVGPPGVGKTSLGRSIAEALGRRFVRVSLGGVRDEAEIRGHRRTYVGALPGRIIQTMRLAGTINPVFMMDEIDKVGADFRGDPSAALLEVLDPEQNSTFSDHYLDVPYDLSKVMFITTANVLDPVPPALRDRMEVIELPGYTEEEKLEIARRFIVPKQLAEHGLTPAHLAFTDEAIRHIIRQYTREAGLRNLEREIGSICRKVARRVASGTLDRAASAPAAPADARAAPTAALAARGPASEVGAGATETAPVADQAGRPAALVTVEPKDLAAYLGPARFDWDGMEATDEVGVATGVYYTEVGGELATVEVTLMEGKGNLILTGQLGDVLKESARAALSYTRSRAPRLGIDPKFAEERDIHIHLPSGAVPKDGPSAGITMATALISALTRQPVRRDVAMTGEITLRGRVLPIGGLKEKVLAAHRAGIKTFILPKRNEKDLVDVPAEVRAALEFVPVERMEEVLRVALPEARASAAEPTAHSDAAPTLAVASP